MCQSGDPIFIEVLLFAFRSFRATVHGGAGGSLSRVFNLIKEVQKKFKTRELEKKELEVG